MNYKVTLIGTGKTGGEIANLLGADHLLHACDIDNPPTLEKIRQSDLSIVFVPGDQMPALIPMLLEAGKPAIIGSTGFSWPSDIDDKLKQKNTTWIRAHNFSLGMTLVKQVLKILGLAPTLMHDPQFSLHEIHHVHKKDAPSGTALSWKEWLGRPETPISSERIGDVFGIHQLKITTNSEEIFLEHKALNRKIFAQGVVWACERVFSNSPLPKGLIHFEQLTEHFIKDQLCKI